MESNQHDDDSTSAIQKFYSGKSIFITGGFGFLGKVLIQKLLRSCSEIHTIYLLVRSKRDKSPESRLNEMFENSLYDRVREKMPNFREKIVPVIGDLSFKNLKLSDIDEALLINQVSIIFHVAANIHFNETITNAAMINVNGTKHILNLAKRMQNLKSFIHISTVYAHCYENIIEERFYALPIDYKIFMNSSKNITDEVVNISSRWPNTYTFTKAVAETFLEKEGIGLPIAIFRPSIVMPCANEPIKGWIDNYVGPIGITTAFLSGLLKFIPTSGNYKLNLVPVDLTINALIVSAWDVYNHSCKIRKNNDILIYNFATAEQTTFKSYIKRLRINYESYPINNVIWPPSLMFMSHIKLYKICMWLVYFPMVLLTATITMCTGQRPTKIWNCGKKINNLVNVLSYFLQNEWTITNKNVQTMWNRLSEKDQQIFKFEMKEFNWIYYFDTVYKGVRLYLFKEDNNDLKRAQIKQERFYWIQKMLLILLMYFIYITFYCFFLSYF